MSDTNNGKRQLGKVTRVEICRDDRRFLTLWLQIDFGGNEQAFGGINLATYDDTKMRAVGHAAGTDFVLRMLDLFGVNSLDAIKGRYVYALRDTYFDPIHTLEIPKVDGGRRFATEEWRREMFPERFACGGDPNEAAPVTR